MPEGSEFFDNDHICQSYESGRHRPDSPNESLERPVFLELLDNVSGKHILDLGCGDGMFGRELLAAGGQSYLGLEASQQMVKLAGQNLQGTIGQVVHTKIEDWVYPEKHFDVVISRLALHYVADLDAAFSRVNHTLKENGQFVFSIVHPVITSSDKSREGGGRREDWIVDNYFSAGSRRVFFMDQYVEQYHRTIEDIYGSLQDANFRIEHLRESSPKRENFADVDLYERRKRIPLFLFLSSRKR